MKKIFLTIFIFLMSFSFLPLSAQASDLDQRSQEIRNATTGKNSILGRIATNEQGFNAADESLGEGAQEALLFIKVGEGILVMLRFSGVLLLVVVMYASILWLTAGGNDDKVAQARKWITNGIIGLIIVSIAHINGLYY